MSWFENSSPDTEDVFDAAASWVYRTQHDPALKQSPEFKAWIKAPEHYAAFDAMLSAMETINAMRNAPKIAEMRRAARARFERQGMAALFSWRTGFLTAAAALILIVGAEMFFYQGAQTQSYTTQIGERRVVTLSDGSKI